MRTKLLVLSLLSSLSLFSVFVVSLLIGVVGCQPAAEKQVDEANGPTASVAL